MISDVKSLLIRWNKTSRLYKSYQSDLEKNIAHEESKDVAYEKSRNAKYSSIKAKRINKIASKRLFKKLINKYKRFKVSENEEQNTHEYWSK